MSNEQRYYDALKRISKYDSVERLRRDHWNVWGCEHPEEVIEMAYENVIAEAKVAIRGRRRPREGK